MFQHQCRLLWHQCIIGMSGIMCGGYVFNGWCIVMQQLQQQLSKQCRRGDQCKFMLYQCHTRLHPEQWLNTIGMCVCDGMECMFMCGRYI